jgi:hypothetical protein
MKKNSMKGQALYQKLKTSREQLVKKYESAGTIRYDEAIGLIPVGGNPALSTAPATLGAALVVNTGRREKRVPDHREDGTLIAANGRTVLDLDAIKAANIADGIPSGSMMDALKKRAEGKTILLFTDDAALRYGTIILGEVSCQLKLMGDIVNAIRNAVFPGFQASNTTLNGVSNTGLIHALPGTVEQESLSHRGFYKPVNYRGDVEYLKDPTSIWATTDASRQPFMALGVNSEVRMWGKDQVIDLNGFRIGAHERPNRVAAFSSIIDLSDGHFAGLSTKGARNAHIYSSVGKGRLARNNHFAIRGHFVKDLLVEGIFSGDESTINQGSYFGTAILNDSERVVFKDVHQEMLNKAVANSSMALSHYAQLFNVESLFGYFERPSTWEATGKASYPWMKWELLAAGATDTFGNGKTTRLPVFKTEAELVTAGVPLASAPALHKALRAAKAAYSKSMKSADDTYIQVNTGHNSLNVSGANRAGLSMDTLQRMTDVKQIPRSTNLIAQNPKTSDGFRYPDSVSYGFRIGSASEGVGPLAESRGGTVQDVYVMDCSFAGMHLSPMETVAITGQSGFNKTFNGNGLRPFGYTNTLSDAASIAPASILLSKEAMEEAIPAFVAEESPVKSFDIAAKAVTNTLQTGWTAKKAHGLYKGNDVVESSLAALEAIGLLKKFFTAAAPRAVLSGVDNSNIDIGILALRKTMMTAIDALTACHVGLKGGFQGDIFADDNTYYGYGEIYPWYVKSDSSVDIDKDIILQQAAARTNRRLTTSYLAVELPQCSDSIFKLKQVSSDTMALVKADTEVPVTYEECISLLGFGSGSGPVIFKMTRNLDGQHHVHKGVFGVRIDAASGFAIENVVVKDLETVEAKQPTKALGSKEQQLASGVQKKDEMESGVLKARGISINGCTDGSIERVFISESSAGGDMVAVEIRGKSSSIEVESITVDSLKGQEKSVGVKISKDVSDIEVSKVRASEMSTESEFGISVPVEIQSEIVKLK